MDLVNVEPVVVEGPKLQTCMSKKYTPSGLFVELSKPTKALWQALLEPVLQGEGSAQECILRCKRCRKWTGTPSNPSQAFTRHKALNCIEVAAPTDTLGMEIAVVPADANPFNAVAGPSRAAQQSSKQQKIGQYSLTPGTSAKVMNELAMWFFTTETPFARINSPYLQKAFLTLGITIPSDTSLRTTHLDRCYDNVLNECQQMLQHIQVGACNEQQRMHATTKTAHACNNKLRAACKLISWPCLQ